MRPQDTAAAGGVDLDGKQFPIHPNGYSKQIQSLDGIEVNDKVIISYGYSEKQIIICSRVTPTMAIFPFNNGDIRFRKKDARVIGGGTWYGKSLYNYSVDEEEKVNNQRSYNVWSGRLSNMRWGSLPFEVVKEVHKLVKPYMANAS